MYLLEYADELFPVPAQYADGLEDEVEDEEGAGAVADLVGEPEPAPARPGRRQTRAERAIQEAPPREIVDRMQTHPLARALLLQWIIEAHNNQLNGEDAQERMLMCKELRVFPRANLRRDPKEVFVQLPLAAFL
jgi:hypothetical protein